MRFNEVFVYSHSRCIWFFRIYIFVSVSSTLMYLDRIQDTVYCTILRFLPKESVCDQICDRESSLFVREKANVLLKYTLKQTPPHSLEGSIIMSGKFGRLCNRVFFLLVFLMFRTFYCFLYVNLNKFQIFSLIHM